MTTTANTTIHVDTASDPWLTVREAAALSRTSTWSVYQAVKRSRLRAARVNGRRDLRIRASWVHAWLESAAEPVEIQR